MSRKVFVAGEILTAADVNANLMDQAVMSFAGTAARGSAIPSPVEGMTTYLEDSNILSLYDGGAWKTSLSTTGGILQVVSTTKTDTFSTSSSTFTDITGLSATITPKSTSSKILITATVNYNLGGTDIGGVRLLRDSTAIAIGDAAGSRSQGFATTRAASNLDVQSSSVNFLDSPATTSAITYKIQIKGEGNTLFVNRNAVDTDSAIYFRVVSDITLIEVAG